jgi:hypothetical protein
MLYQSRCWGRMKLSQSFSANARMNLTQALTVLAWKSQRQTTTSTSSHALFFFGRLGFLIGETIVIRKKK